MTWSLANPGDKPADCNCPPVEDVMRGRAGGTKDPCPVHDTPELQAMLRTMVVPMRSFPGTTSYAFDTRISQPASSANADGFGMGC